jgi:hypothetical protein
VPLCGNWQSGKQSWRGSKKTFLLESRKHRLFSIFCLMNCERALSERIAVQIAAHALPNSMYIATEIKTMELPRLRTLFNLIAYPALNHISEYIVKGNSCSGCSDSNLKNGYFVSFLDFLISFQSTFCALGASIPITFGLLLLYFLSSSDGRKVYNVSKLFLAAH